MIVAAFSFITSALLKWLLFMLSSWRVFCLYTWCQQLEWSVHALHTFLWAIHRKC